MAVLLGTVFLWISCVSFTQFIGSISDRMLTWLDLDMYNWNLGENKTSPENLTKAEAIITKFYVDKKCFNIYSKRDHLSGNNFIKM